MELAIILCGAQQYRALMMILQYRKSLSMISMMLSQCLISCVFQVLSPVLFGNPYISPFNSQNIYLLMLRGIYYKTEERCHALKRSFTPPQKWLFSTVTWGVNYARAHVHLRPIWVVRTHREAGQARAGRRVYNFAVYSRRCNTKTASRPKFIFPVT